MKYLSAEDIIKINVMVIGKYSPKEPVGIADPNSLKMIVEQPKQEIFGKVLYPDIYSKAAIIWINLIKKHPFYSQLKQEQDKSASRKVLQFGNTFRRCFLM